MSEGWAAFVSESPSPHPFVGELLEGRYRIVREIAAGGMSTVFEAIHVKIGRKVAIKVLHREMAGDPEVVARFLNEARAVGTFGHPNIVASTDFGELPGHIPFLVLEYLEGHTLAKEIAASGPLPLRRMVRIALQVASALDAAHGCGVVHRDLTSDNIFLIRNEGNPDHVKVLDFGISKFLTATDFSPKTRRGLTMGTPEFMAPEQISDPQAVDARADIYALGVISYQMLAGWPPFGRLPLQTLLTQIVVEPPPPIDRPGIPDGLRAIVMKALAKSPADRFPNMQAMGIALEQYGSLVFSNEGFSGRIPMPLPDLPTQTGSQAIVATASRLVPTTGGTAPHALQEVATAPHQASQRTWGPTPPAIQVGPVASPVSVPEKKRRGGWVVGLTLMGATAAFGYLWLRRPEVAPSPAPVSSPSPATAPSPAPAAPVPIRYEITSRTPQARVTLRGRTRVLPFAEAGTPGTQPEAVELTAPGREGLRFWITFDHPFRLAADLHDGHAVVEATAEETLVALGGPVINGVAPQTAGRADARRSNTPARHAVRGKVAAAIGGVSSPPSTGDSTPRPPAAVDPPKVTPMPAAEAPSPEKKAPPASATLPALKPAVAVLAKSPPTAIAPATRPVSPPKSGPAAPVPAVAARPTTPGGVDPAKTQAIVRGHLPEIQRCYERGRMDDPDLKGRVTVRITISAIGAVSAARIDSSTLGNGGVEGCILNAVQTWKFPAPIGGSAVISYPFNLR